MGKHHGNRGAIATPIYLLALALTLQPELSAQCQGSQIPSLPALGAQSLDGEANIRISTAWDPDGPGPQPEQIVVVGDFDIIRQSPSTGMSVLNPTNATWYSLLPPTVASDVRHLAATPSGRLFAHVATDVYEWNGTSWTSFSSGPFATVYSIGINSAGNLVASGFLSGFPFAVSELIGNQWSTPVLLPTGMAVLNDIQPFGNGFLARSNLQDIVTFDGTSWNTLPQGPWGGTQVSSLATDGTQIHASGTWGVATWDGTSWQVQFPHSTQQVVSYNGELIAGGAGFPSSSPGLVNVDTMQAIGGGLSNAGMPGDISVRTLTVTATGKLFVGGTFKQTGTVAASNVALWTGTSWQFMGNGWNGAVHAAAQLGNGDLIVGGEFSGPGAGGTAVWNGQAWGAPGAGFQGIVRDIAAMPNGSVAVVGERKVGGQVVAAVSTFDGSSWTDLAFPDPSAELAAVAALPDGSLMVGGSFLHPTQGTDLNLMTYDGAWNIVPNLNVVGVANPPTPTVRDLHVLQNGAVIVAGRFSQAGPSSVRSVAVWAGAGWGALPDVGIAQPRFRSISGRTPGELVLTMESPMGILQRTGSTWSTISSNNTLAAHVRSDGLVQAAFRTSRGLFDGTTWQTVPQYFRGHSARILPTTQGTMLVGSFRTGSPSLVHFEDISPPCTAIATPVGTGCSAFGAPATLTASIPPWVGTTTTLNASNFPPQTFQIAVLSTTLNTVPLPQLTPLGLPGCNLYVAPDFLNLASVGQSQSQFDVVVPSNPALAGTQFAAQFLGIEYYGAYVLAQATTSNALEMTIGTF